MWCWRDSLAFAAAASMIAAAGVLFQDAPAHAESFRINNVDHAERINMRQSPTNKAKIVAYIPPEGRLEGTGQCNERWCEVTYKNQNGWVFRKYLIAEAKHSDQQLAAEAEKPAEEEKQAETAALQPKDAETEKAIPSDLQDKTLRLAFTNGRPIPVYAFPSDRLPAAGRISPETGEVEDLGTCRHKFCYIRSGPLVGWIAEDAITKEGSAEAPAASSVEQTAAVAAPPRDAAEATATQTAIHPDALPDLPGSIEIKSYTLAGLADDASLPVIETPEDGARILGWIPGNATSVEGLRKCVLKWCLVRYEGLTGWVARRHLADESIAAAKRYLVSGIALWGALDVFDFPGNGAAVVGHIPAYATGIVPIGNCDKDWCHVRYLGIAGWVAGKYIALQNR
jgi:SH3-like domain-containing protein